MNVGDPSHASEPADVGSVDVAVLGAGPAGLMAAWCLARAGRSVVVLEGGPVVGGLASSFEVAGQRVDHGSHRLHRACDPGVLGALTRLLDGDLQRRERNGRIRLADRWVAFPPQAPDLARNLPLGFAARAARDLVTGPMRRARADTFPEVVRAGLGPTMTDAFYVPYVEKIWGVDAGELSGELARRRVSARSGVDLLRRLRRPDPDAGTFLYPERGFGEIVDRLAGAAISAGASVQLRTRVTGVGDDGTVTAEPVAPGACRPIVVRAGNVLSTVPIPALAAMTDPPPPPDVLQAAHALGYRALVLLYIVVEQPRFTAFDAHYFPGPEIAASRVSEPKNYRDAPDLDPADRTVLCAELPCSVGDEVWRADPGALADRTLEELARLGLPRVRAAHAEVRRVAHAYPVYRVGFETGFEPLDAWASRRPRTLSFGRQGLFAHDNTHHALVMGRDAAGVIGPDGSVDRDRWHRARLTFRDNVVED